MKTLIRYGFVVVIPLALTAVLLGLVGAFRLPHHAVPWHAAQLVEATGGPVVQAGMGPKAASPRGQRETKLVELEVHDVVPLQELGTHAVMLVAKDGGAILPIFVSEEAAVSIAFRLAHQAPPHPLAADLLDDVVAGLGGAVTEIRIDDIRDEVFTGRIFLRQGKKNVELDARPSDAISLALGGRARIFASQKVMSEGSISREDIDELRRSMPGVGGSGPGQGPGGAGPLTPPGQPPRGSDSISL